MSVETLYEAGTEEEVEAYLGEMIFEEVGDYQTFEGGGIMTMNRGLVFRTADAEFQLTIVRSR